MNPIVPSTSQWAGRIRKAWNLMLKRALPDILEVGRKLVEAKAALGRGEWCRMFDERLLPMGQRSAHMFITIYQNKVLSNRNHGSTLPVSWRTLYELAKVPEDRLLQAINDGDITPEMQRKDVVLLRESSDGRQSSDLLLIQLTISEAETLIQESHNSNGAVAKIKRALERKRK